MRYVHVPAPGLVMVKARIVTFCAPAMWTIMKLPLYGTMTRGALITACHVRTERNCMLFFPAGTITCSAYVPGQTLIRSPDCAAVTASLIVAWPGLSQLVPGGAYPPPFGSSSFTQWVIGSFE